MFILYYISDYNNIFTIIPLYNLKLQKNIYFILNIYDYSNVLKITLHVYYGYITLNPKQCLSYTI